ncbi:MAG: YciI-like protein [Pseudomonadota bacterium]
MHFLLFYTYVSDILERRPQFRGAHVKHARESVARGELILGGALADPVDWGVLLFSTSSRDLVEAFAKADPYVTGGLVTEWKVRPWTTVIGADAANPLPPGL